MYGDGATLGDGSKLKGRAGGHMRIWLRGKIDISRLDWSKKLVWWPAPRDKVGAVG